MAREAVATEAVARAGGGGEGGGTHTHPHIFLYPALTRVDQSTARQEDVAPIASILCERMRSGRCQHVCMLSDAPGSSRRAHLEEEVAGLSLIHI